MSSEDREIRESGKQHTRNKRTRYTSWPQQAGQMNFDLNNGMEETPYQNSNKRKCTASITGDDGSASHTRDEFVDMSSHQYAELITAELDAIQFSSEEALVEQSHVPLLAQSRRQDGPREPFDAVQVETTSDSSRIPDEIFSLPWDNGLQIPSLEVQSDYTYESAEFSQTDDCSSYDLLYDFTAESDDGHSRHRLLRDLETRPITVPQLIQEVKEIYAGLAMVERKCIEIVDTQLRSSNKLTKEQWQALIALHRTLLNEHHDFFNVTHHPAVSSPELRELASKFAMPARMWKYGIHGLLELIRQSSLKNESHMNSVFNNAFIMLNRSEADVSDMADDWTEIGLNLHGYVHMLRRLEASLPETQAELSSRGRYLCSGLLQSWHQYIDGIIDGNTVAAEASSDADKLHDDCDVWRYTASQWYDQASDMSPITSRIRHHLAILARGNTAPELSTSGDSPDGFMEGDQYSQSFSTPPLGESYWFDNDLFKHLDSNNSLWVLMAGWYQFGGHIARDLRGFYKLFAFLPWAAGSFM